MIDSSKHPSLAHCLRWQDRHRPAGPAPGPGQPRGRVLLEQAGAPARHRRRELHDEVFPGRGRGPVERAERRLPPAGRLGCPIMRMRYEDFIAGAGTGHAPDRRLRRAAGPGGLSLPRRRRRVLLGPSWTARHSVSGNPMRFTTGQVPISRDERWRTAHAQGAAARRHRAHLPAAGWLRVPGSETVTVWPSVGVVLPTHDRPGPLRTALAAVLAQDYPGEAPRGGGLRPGRARPGPGRQRPRDGGRQRQDARAGRAPATPGS